MRFTVVKKDMAESQEKKLLAQKEKIAEWVKDGRKKQTVRKQRNQALIHLGLAAMKMVTSSERELVDFLRHIDDKKQDVVRDVVEDEIRRLGSRSGAS